MKTTKILTILLAISLAACRNKSEDLKRGQQQYDVVQEGSAAGVSSTINPLNETPPAPATAMTSTAVDTTTNFTLPGTQMPVTATDGGSVASTLPPIYDTTPRRAAPRPRPAEPQRAPAPAPMASSTPETTDTTTPPPATNTTTTATDTSTDPAKHVEGENKSEEKKEEPPPPPPPINPAFPALPA